MVIFSEEGVMVKVVELGAVRSRVIRGIVMERILVEFVVSRRNNAANPKIDNSQIAQESRAGNDDGM